MQKHKGAREYKISEVALRDLTESDRNHTSPQRLLNAQDTYSTSQLE